MQYSLLGRTGLLVSRLALGSMTFTGGERTVPSINSVDQQLAERLVGTALDAGVNFFDTADNYDLGQSEVVLGQALKGRRNDAIIATKVGMRTGQALNRSGLSRRHILQSVEESLTRLGTDWIDVYIAHRPDPFTPIDEVVDAFDDVVRSGKARYIGFSNWPAWRAVAALERQKARSLAQFSHAQMYYSVLGRDIEVEIAPMLAEYGLGLSCWSPLSSGFLSGKYSRESLDDPSTRFGSRFGVDFDRETGFLLLDQLRDVAARLGASQSQVALAWLLAKANVSVVILGASSLEQLEDNLRSAEIALSREDIELLDSMSPPRRPYPQSYDRIWRDKTIDRALASRSRDAGTRGV